MNLLRFAFFAFAGLALSLLAAPAFGQSVEPVEVVNFPDLQEVKGSVEIVSPTPHSRLVARREVLVSPGALESPGDAVALGIVDAAGFTDVVVSVHGLSTDRLSSPGLSSGPSKRTA